MMTEFKGKWHVKCPEHSEFIQRKLLSMGEAKGFTDIDDEYTNSPYIARNLHYYVCGDNIEFFNAEKAPDLTNHPDWCWPRPEEKKPYHMYHVVYVYNSGFGTFKCYLKDKISPENYGDEIISLQEFVESNSGYKCAIINFIYLGETFNYEVEDKQMKPWNELEIEEKFACVSLYPDEAKNDEHWNVRLHAYRALGFTKEAFQDEDWEIRLEAYRALGFTKDALNYGSCTIRREAEIYFRIKEGD